MERMLDNLETIRIVTTCFEQPKGYGRIVKNEHGIFERIVEEKDATAEQRRIQCVNGGIYAVNCGVLCRYLPLIQNHNEQREYYLTDIVKIIKTHEKISIKTHLISEEENKYISGVNTPEELAALE
jgi:bifunctional UDP-N-acetylglucosamine pyrophosphorylase/glucosamine-1-phosphate N-acetyltransferase